MWDDTVPPLLPLMPSPQWTGTKAKSSSHFRIRWWGPRWYSSTTSAPDAPPQWTDTKAESSSHFRIRWWGPRYTVPPLLPPMPPLSELKRKPRAPVILESDDEDQDSTLPPLLPGSREEFWKESTFQNWSTCCKPLNSIQWWDCIILVLIIWSWNDWSTWLSFQFTEWGHRGT